MAKENGFRHAKGLHGKFPGRIPDDDHSLTIKPLGLALHDTFDSDNSVYLRDGKDYDMPIAVLSSLALGLAVDFAIHFLARARETVQKNGSWKDSVGPMFDEPARAITRNIIVIAVGFTPLLAAPLVPYKTVGAFLATILTVAGVATLLILPALIRLLEKKLFPEFEANKLLCKCTICIVASITAVLVIVINVHEYIKTGWTVLTVISLLTVIASVFLCSFLSHRERCNTGLEKVEK